LYLPGMLVDGKNDIFEKTELELGLSPSY